jgi:pyruvate ferredoxin oxidoreductase beta subunit
MIDYNVFVSRLTSKTEVFHPGHRACVGCGEALAVRLVGKALGKNIIVSNATGCMEIVASPLPTNSWSVPWIHTLFETTASVASGIESGIKAMTRKGLRDDDGVKVVGVGGDGASFDIGMGQLSGMMERGHDVLYVCFDNEAYMNTGIQRSSATPFGASTTTSPAGTLTPGQMTQKKDMVGIAAAHRLAYVATACHSYPFDLIRKIEKAKAVKGPSYVHVLSVCPTGWRTTGDLSIRYGRLAVETGVFPLYEIENGEYTLNMDFPKLRPVTDYLKGQGRFRHLTEDMIATIQAQVNTDYAKLKEKASNA